MVNDLSMEKEEVFGEKIKDINYVVRKGVYGVTFNKHRQVAMVRNQYGYFLPGGGIEEGENFEECLRREFIEETGYSIIIKNYIGKASKYYYAESFNHFRHPIGTQSYVSFYMPGSSKWNRGII